MRRAFYKALFASLAFFIAAVAIVTPPFLYPEEGSQQLASAQSSPEAAPFSPGAPGLNEIGGDYYAGLWRKGKAVFSDIKLFDIFKKYTRGYTPEQPISYSHVIHVKKLGIECQYCHSGVSKSSYATVPSVETCMGCHNVVQKGSEEIKKLAKYWEEQKPVEWEPVNHLPEHAVFNHQRHVKAGVGCHSCHGQVQNMPVVEKVSSLKMGFCISCHRDRGVSFDCAVCHY